MPLSPFWSQLKCWLRKTSWKPQISLISETIIGSFNKLRRPDAILFNLLLDGFAFTTLLAISKSIGKYPRILLVASPTVHQQVRIGVTFFLLFHLSFVPILLHTSSNTSPTVQIIHVRVQGLSSPTFSTICGTSMEKHRSL